MDERSTTNPPFPYTRNQEALKDFEVLKQVENQTPEICMEAVKKYGWALRLIENQTPELCIASVKRNPSTLQFVKNQTPEICMTAVKQKGWALELVKNQTPEICLEAIKQNEKASKFIKEELKQDVLNKYQQYLESQKKQSSIDKKSLFIDKNKSTYKEKIMETNNKKESLLFYEESTGKILRVAATADEYLFDWAVYNTENDEIISTFLKYKVNTLFDKKDATEINKAVDTAMAISGINKLDVYILDQDEFEKKIERYEKNPVMDTKTYTIFEDENLKIINNRNDKLIQMTFREIPNEKILDELEFYKWEQSKQNPLCWQRPNTITSIDIARLSTEKWYKNGYFAQQASQNIESSTDKKSLFIDKNKSTYKEKTMSDLNEKVEGNSTQVLGKSDRTPVERITTDKFKQLLAADNLPFLPNENGFCNVKAVKTSAGYEPQGANQLIAKTYLHERGMDNDNILTFRQAQKAKTSIRAGEKGFYLSFYDQEKGANTVTRYFAESQTSKPDLIPYQPVKAESKKEKHVQISSDAQDYITNYLKCVNENRAFTASPEVAAEFKENFAKELEKSPMQIFKMGDRAAKEIFIETDKGKEWLKTDKGRQWLNTENGKDFLKANPDKGLDKGKEVQKSVKPIERAIAVER